MKRTYYLDTSIWNFYFAEDSPDFQKATIDFFNNLNHLQEELYICQVVLDEFEDAPDSKRIKLERLTSQFKPILLDITKESEDLAVRYIDEGILHQSDYADALHIAISSMYELDYLLSWNFRHIANIPKSEKINAVNLLCGYTKEIIITTPLGVREDE